MFSRFFIDRPIFATVLSIALGALAFVLFQHVTRAGWSAVVRRVSEATMATLPLFAVLFLPIAVLGFHSLYPWSHESDAILEAKRWWLGANEGNGSGQKFYVRAVIFFGIWTVLSQLLWRWSVQQDKLVDDIAARDALSDKLQTLSAGGTFLYALSLSFAAIDWLMSLQPHWYSTMYGVYYFAGAILGFYAFLALATMALQKGGMLKTAVTTEHYHDIGKFVFGHTVFWAYILFLVSRHVKRSRVGLAIGSIWILAAHVIDIYWNVLPNFGAHGGHDAVAGAAHGAAGEVAEAVAHHAPGFSLHLLDFTAFIGIVGLFIATFVFILKKHAVICLGDPRLAESLRHENY